MNATGFTLGLLVLLAPEVASEIAAAFTPTDSLGDDTMHTLKFLEADGTPATLAGSIRFPTERQFTNADRN